MEWITDNLEWLTPTTVLAMYIIARIIVILTPTPKDDEALEKVSGLVRALAKTFGLDLKQGRKLPVILITATALMCATGCATFDAFRNKPAAQYKLTKTAFVECVDVLAMLRSQGKFDESESAAITRVIKLGQEVLNKWADALIDGKDYPNGYSLMLPVITQLKGFITDKGGRI